MAEERMLVRVVRVFSNRLADRLEVRAAVKRAKELAEKGSRTEAESAEKCSLERKIAMTRALNLMHMKRLSRGERRERDRIASWMGDNGNLVEHVFLKEWAVSGELCCRPPPSLLGGAIAKGGYDELHVKRIGQTIAMGALADRVDGGWVYGREVPAEEQYYLAQLIVAESGLLLQELSNGDNVFLALLEDRASKMAAFMESQKPAMVEKLRKEMEA